MGCEAAKFSMFEFLPSAIDTAAARGVQCDKFVRIRSGAGPAGFGTIRVCLGLLALCAPFAAWTQGLFKATRRT
jgi:hypothetical protein